FQIFLIVLYLFFFGAVGGWVLELLFRRFFSGANPERKWLNPGFLFGPCLPLYGFGTVLLFILSELDHQLFGSFSGTFWYYPVMFVVMALAMTLLEYIVGVVSFKGFHLRLWDYSKLWGNIQASSARCSRSSGACCRWRTTFCCIRGWAGVVVAHPLASFMVGVASAFSSLTCASPSISARSAEKGRRDR
ncbi:MAG: putative ABC transporter permease, partial [Christensenellales bacterium]